MAGPALEQSQQVEDAAKRFIAAAKSNGPATGCSSKVKAAVDGAVKASKGAYDVVGLIGMTCRHGSPLLMCDVRDSGESHFYAFALIEHLLYACEGRISSLGVCYDIGCKLAVSPRMRKALASSALLAALRPFPSPKITFVVSLFHVYGHDLDCQLKYSPRRNVGYGLTDGESLERLWSALGDQISVTRNMSLVGRQHTLSSHLAFLVREHLMRSASMLESRRARVDAERIKAAPKIVAAVISVAHHASAPAALPSPISAVPNGFPAAHVDLVPGFASLSLRRQSEALARGAARRKRTSGDALSRSAKRLYTFVSQVHALESWIKRRGNVASQKATERLVTAKRTAVLRSKRTLLEVNDAIKLALIDARAPVQNALQPILEADVLKADTLTQLARYGDFVDRAQDPWFLDDNLSQGLDAYELLVRCDEEHSRIRLEQENIRTWIARTITHLEGSRYASRVPGWTELVAQELSRFRALDAWWDRPTSGSAAAEATVATGDGFDTDDDSDDDFAEAEDSSALSAKGNAPETKDSSDIPPSTGESPRGDHSNSGHQTAISEQVWDRTSLADAERDDLDVSDNEFDKKWGGVEDGKTEAEAGYVICRGTGKGYTRRI
ncbi:hypothetical protein OC835_004312 [Tilletia horrida]|nr:hypothetical protein OC835_004312 [Tilletia horrida]